MKNKRFLIILSALATMAILFLVLELTHVTNFIKLHPKPTATPQGPTPAQKQQEDAASTDAKKQLVESKDTTPPATTPTASNNIDLSTRQESNGTVTVFTRLTGYSSGTCSLTVTNGGKTKTQTASVIYQSQYSTCAGFSVPISSVGTGTWSLALTVTANDIAASKTITAEVK